MRRFKIIGLSYLGDSWRAVGENGEKHLLDCITAAKPGNIPDGIDLTGRTIECEYLYPYIEFAHDARIVEEEAA